ncbi:ammonium transporter [Chrysochromulina tobinii]|uniref:Ammonium transporter n=1 Tax=Chrysochromulina tobinii TaxID=1460289 RepID=A0A0M0K2C5_9EUKA|nr:ammonium transporter [Chrysochromulina tobinii]|eukprot:KOO32950.1 ammonium transporter [Chrysochromulina sp. CCMP291]
MASITQAEYDSLISRLAAVEEENAATLLEVDTFFLLWASALIFMMQAGFATLSAGSIRAKNVKNILLKNVLDACVGAIVWYCVGYGLAYDADNGVNGHKAIGFIGSGPTNFALSSVGDHSGQDKGKTWIMWQFQYAFAASAATIVSGAVAERCQLGAYLIYTAVITGLVYPVVVHWVWDPAGFLSAFNSDDSVRIYTGCTDFAGSCVVHMVGGWAALVAAWVLGPRIGRWERPELFEGHSTPLVIIGTFLLWFGWYGFNPGSTLMIHGQANVAARATVTTTLGAAAGGISGLFIKRHLPEWAGGTGLYDIAHTCNSLLAGLVGVTAGCSVIYPWAAIVIGFFAALAYHFASCLMRRLRIDDPLDAFAVHGASGLLGTIMVGVFAVKEYHTAIGVVKPDAGIFMPGTTGEILAAQVVSAIIVIIWVVCCSLILFGTLKALGIFRVPAEYEVAGLDVSKHGGSAYSSEANVALQFSQKV